MRAQQLQQKYFLKWSEVYNEGARQAHEAGTACSGHINELAAHSRAKAQELWQTYVQAARAAAAGDDASLRTITAYQDFQREYAKLELEYVQSVGDAYGTAASSIGAAHSGLCVKMLDAYLAYLQELRSDLANASSPQPPADRS